MKGRDERGSEEGVRRVRKRGREIKQITAEGETERVRGRKRKRDRDRERQR